MRHDLGARPALDEISGLAKTLREQDPSLTEAQAFTKAYESNRELRARHYQVRMGALGVRLDGGKVMERVV